MTRLVAPPEQGRARVGAKAWLEVGDMITRVAGTAADTIDPAALRSELRQEGRTVQLRVQWGADTMEKKLTLRRLL